MKRTLYRCNGEKCGVGMPLCFHTTDPAYASPVYAPLEFDDETKEGMEALGKVDLAGMLAQELSKPMEGRMACKQGIIQTEEPHAV